MRPVRVEPLTCGFKSTASSSRSDQDAGPRESQARPLISPSRASPGNPDAAVSEGVSNGRARARPRVARACSRAKRIGAGVSQLLLAARRVERCTPASLVMQALSASCISMRSHDSNPAHRRNARKGMHLYPTPPRRTRRAPDGATRAWRVGAVTSCSVGEPSLLPPGWPARGGSKDVFVRRNMAVVHAAMVDERVGCL
jgi:hypothetical protein